MYSLRNLVQYPRMSEETIAFNGTLYKGSKKIALCSNGGYGGPNEVHYINQNDRVELQAYLKTLPPDIYEGKSYEIDEDSFISELVEQSNDEKIDKKMISQYTKKGYAIVAKMKKKTSVEYMAFKTQDSYDNHIKENPSESWPIIHQDSPEIANKNYELKLVKDWTKKGAKLIIKSTSNGKEVYNAFKGEAGIIGFVAKNPGLAYTVVYKATA